MESSSENSNPNNKILKLENQENKFTYTEKRIFFGRNPKIPSSIEKSDVKLCVLQDENLQISTSHCSINYFDESYYLLDEGSRNGTFIIVPKKKSVILNDQMILKIGIRNFVINLMSFNEIELYYDDDEMEKSGNKNIAKINLKDNQKFCIGFDDKKVSDGQFLSFNDKELSKKHVIIYRNEEFLIMAECRGQYFFF